MRLPIALRAAVQWNIGMQQRSGYRSLRRGRICVPGTIYFITTVTRDRAPLFATFDAACAVARVSGAAASWPHARVRAWVLMPDHWHGLIELGAAETLGDTISRFKASAARAANAVTGRTGSVWMPGFHDRALRAYEDLRRAARYLVANPLRAGLVESIGDYPFWDATWL